MKDIQAQQSLRAIAGQLAKFLINSDKSAGMRVHNGQGVVGGAKDGLIIYAYRISRGKNGFPVNRADLA
jgi:uncharacterized membrane protein YeaQ/YmgE (transglycosylase-associated protein family)